MFEDLEKIMVATPDEFRTAQFANYEDILSAVVNVALALVSFASLASLAYAFIKMALAKGDFKELHTARMHAYYSLAAIVLCIMAVAIKIVFFNLFGGPYAEIETIQKSVTK